MVQTIKESMDAITLLAPEAGFKAPSLKEKAVICDDGTSGGLRENEPTPHGVITRILHGLNQIIRQEADIASIANTRAWLIAYLRPADNPVLPKQNVYSLTGEKLALELWVNAAEQTTPVNNTPDNTENLSNDDLNTNPMENSAVTDILGWQVKSAGLGHWQDKTKNAAELDDLIICKPGLVEKTNVIAKDINYTTLIPGSISCTREFSAWDDKSAPYCQVFQFATGKDNRIVANSDMLARLCPFLPINFRESVKTETKDGKTYRATIMEATPDAVFTQDFNRQTLSGTLIVVEIKSRELLSQRTNYSFYKDLYQITIASICVRSENDLMEIKTMPVLRYRDCVVVVKNYQGLYQHIMACAPEVRKFMIDAPAHISASNLAKYCATSIMLKQST